MVKASNSYNSYTQEELDKIVELANKNPPRTLEQIAEKINRPVLGVFRILKKRLFNTNKIDNQTSNLYQKQYKAIFNKRYQKPRKSDTKIHNTGSYSDDEIKIIIESTNMDPPRTLEEILELLNDRTARGLYRYIRKLALNGKINMAAYEMYGQQYYLHGDNGNYKIQQKNIRSELIQGLEYYLEKFGKDSCNKEMIHKILISCRKTTTSTDNAFSVKDYEKYINYIAVKYNKKVKDLANMVYDILEAEEYKHAADSVSEFFNLGRSPYLHKQKHLISDES